MNRRFWNVLLCAKICIVIYILFKVPLDNMTICSPCIPFLEWDNEFTQILMSWWDPLFQFRSDTNFWINSSFFLVGKLAISYWWILNSLRIHQVFVRSEDILRFVHLLIWSCWKLIDTFSAINTFRLFLILGNQQSSARSSLVHVWSE